MGSEREELASSQDEDDWNDKLDQRQNLYVTPRIIVPFVDRLIALGVLPPPAEGYLVEWPELSGKSESQQATIGGQRTTALVAYAGQPAAPALMAPMDFFTRIMGFTEDEAQTIVDNAEEEKKRIQAEEDAKAKVQAKVQADALAKAQAQQASQTPSGPDGGGPSGPGLSGGGGPGGGQPPGDNVPRGGGRPFDGPAGNVFCPTGPGGGVDPSCSPKSTPPASRAERLAKRIEREEAVRKKLGEGRIRTVKEAIKDLLPQYAYTTVYGTRVKAFDPAVPEDHLVAEMGRRGLPTARGAVHRVLDAMAFAGEIVKVTTGAGDPLSPNKMLHSYRLPRPVTGNVASRPASGMVRVTSGGRVWYEPAPMSEDDPIANAFCATGPGGGVDPSCSPSRDGSAGAKVARPSVDDVRDHIERVRSAGATPKDMAKLAASLSTLTVRQLTELKKSLGLRAGGRKSELARKVAEQATARLTVREHYVREARKEGYRVADLRAAARDVRQQTGAYVDSARAMLKDARATYAGLNPGKALTRAHRAFKGGDHSDIAGFDTLARTMAGRHPELLGAHGYEHSGGGYDVHAHEAEQRLYDFLYAGPPKRPPPAEVYGHALDALRNAGPGPRSRGRRTTDEEVPF
jgi:hypothetical protein